MENEIVQPLNKYLEIYTLTDEEIARLLFIFRNTSTTDYIKRITWEFYKNKGFSEKQVAGIMGNIM